MQVWNVLRVARWKCRIQKFAIWAPSHNCHAISLQLRHVSTVGKKLVKQQCPPHMSSRYGELWPTNGWDLLASLGHPSKFQRVRAWAALLHGTLVVGVNQSLWHWTEVPPIFSRAAITLGIGSHSSIVCCQYQCHWLPGKTVPKITCQEGR